jgi:flagellar motor protein MotB
MDSNNQEKFSISVGHRNWLLTFGDLLTLLLCFFIAIVSFSPLNNSPKRKEFLNKSGSYVDQNGVHENKTISDSTGTTLADNALKERHGDVRPPIEEFWFEEKDFSTQITDLTEMRSNEFKNLVTTSYYVASQIEIELCRFNKEGDKEQAALLSMLRTQALRRQVIDAMPNLSKEALLLSYSGDSCKRVPQKEDQNSRIALIRIYWSQANG